MGYRFDKLKFQYRYGTMSLQQKRTVMDAIVRSFNELKVLEFDGNEFARLNSLWTSQRSNLGELAVTLRENDEGKSQWHIYMDLVQRKCPNLKSIVLDNPWMTQTFPKEIVLRSSPLMENNF